jgi:hypothetical protein
VTSPGGETGAVISECVIVIGKDWLVVANDEVHLHGAPGYRAKTPSAQRKAVVISTNGRNLS